MKGYTGIVRILIEYGAKLDPVNDEDLTPLHLAAKNGHVRYDKIFFYDAMSCNLFPSYSVMPVQSILVAEKNL